MRRVWRRISRIGGKPSRVAHLVDNTCVTRCGIAYGNEFEMGYWYPEAGAGRCKLCLGARGWSVERYGRRKA